MKNLFSIAAFPIVAALCGIVFTVPANADAISFSNLNASTIDADPLATYGPIAGSFSTAEYGTTLTQVSVKLRGVSDSGSVSIQLLSNSSNSPASVLGTIGTLNDSRLTGALSEYAFTPATPFSLAANTRYWIRLTANNSSASWAWSQDISGPGVAREYLSNSNGIFANALEAPYQMQVLTAAPEPSVYGSLGLGVLLLAAAARRRYAA